MLLSGWVPLRLTGPRHGAEGAPKAKPAHRNTSLCSPAGEGGRRRTAGQTAGRTARRTARQTAKRLTSASINRGPVQSGGWSGRLPPGQEQGRAAG